MFCFALIATLVVAYFVVRYLLDLISLDDLSSKHIFITGCDTGFGRELALKLAGRGIPVFAGCFSTEVAFYQHVAHL
jgi:11-cis-retinol dehydrogenase